MANHTPASEQRRLVQRWRASGQTQRAFANAVGINPNTFASWARRFPKRPADGSPAFLEVVAEPVEEAAPPFICAVEVDGRRRWTLTLGAPPAPEWLGALLSAVTAC